MLLVLLRALNKQAECAFRACNLLLISHNRNVKKLLLSQMSKACEGIVVPECHNLKVKALQRFVTLRLRIWAKEQQTKLVSQDEGGHDGELGSRSMAMRVVVKKIK